MTDSTGFCKTLVAKVSNFISAYEDLVLMSDRIAADSFLSTNAATAAAKPAVNRADLTAADFDNFKSAMVLLQSKLNASDPSVNTGGSVRLAFYKIM